MARFGRRFRGREAGPTRPVSRETLQTRAIARASAATATNGRDGPGTARPGIHHGRRETHRLAAVASQSPPSPPGREKGADRRPGLFLAFNHSNGKTGAFCDTSGENLSSWTGRGTRGGFGQELRAPVVPCEARGGGAGSGRAAAPAGVAGEGASSPSMGQVTERRGRRNPGRGRYRIGPRREAPSSRADVRDGSLTSVPVCQRTVSSRGRLTARADTGSAPTRRLTQISRCPVTARNHGWLWRRLR
jgi:hypothetical protein